MAVEAKVHTYFTTTNRGGTGADQNASLASYDLDWETGGSC